MSATNTPTPITNETLEAAKLENTVRSEKDLRPKGAVKYRAGFSIEEILKPSFGVKMCPEMDSSQPLDMRTDKNNSVKENSKNKNVYVVAHAGQCQFRSSSPAQANHSSNSSRKSTPDSNNHNTCENSDCYNKGKPDRDYKSPFRDQLVFPQYTDAMMSFEDVSFLTPTSYYNSLSRLYGLNINSIGSRLFHHLGEMKQFMNPLCGNSSLSSNYICSSIYASENSNLKILTANNTNKVTKSTQDGVQNITNNTLQSKPTCTSYKTLAVKPSRTIYPGPERKFDHSGAVSGHRQKTVKNEKYVSGDTDDGDCVGKGKNKFAWPAWVYCTRYSDRPSSGPRYRKPRTRSNNENDKRPRTAFSTQQLHRLRHEFESCPYLSENRRQSLALELGLNESQVKIWFQNKRAKLKKSTGSKNQLALRLMEEGLYNHSTIVVDDDGNKSDSRHGGSGDR